tara:strand:- start:102 stop:290 length:189 start_codon:yes stop_codon:yes gene_type:complete
VIRRIRVSITRDLDLPRFTLSKGDTWEVRPDKIERDGFCLGGGFIRNSDYKPLGLVVKNERI